MPRVNAALASTNRKLKPQTERKLIHMATILTCAVTGGAPIRDNPAVPITPEQIATQAIDAAKAARCRSPYSMCAIPKPRPLQYGTRPLARGGGGASATVVGDVVINLTTGTGAQFQPGKEDPEKSPAPAPNMSRLKFAPVISLR